MHADNLFWFQDFPSERVHCSYRALLNNAEWKGITLIFSKSILKIEVKIAFQNNNSQALCNYNVCFKHSLLSIYRGYSKTASATKQNIYNTMYSRCVINNQQIYHVVMSAFIISQIQGHCQHWVLRASTTFAEGSFSHPCPVKKYCRKYEIL